MLRSKIYYENNKEQKLDYARQRRIERPDLTAKYHQRKIRFKGKRMSMGTDFRIGICSICHKSRLENEIKFTVMHHLKYDPNYPLGYTIEICPSCHRKIHIGTIADVII